MLVIVFFFFKQKTAYEMRISDWSSEVCSSDLLPRVDLGQERRLALPLRLARGWCGSCPERHEEVRDRRGGNRSHQTRECVDGREELFHVGRGALKDRKSVVSGRRGSVSVDRGGCSILQKKTKTAMKQGV